MTRKEWKERGYSVVIRLPLVFVFKPSQDTAYFRAVDNGRWMDVDELSAWSHSHNRPLLEQLRRIVKNCYCGSMGGYIDYCDFCSGLRSVDGERSYVLTGFLGH
jgi:hypothetical protein